MFVIVAPLLFYCLLYLLFDLFVVLGGGWDSEEQRRRARFLNISVSIGPTLPTQAEGSDNSKENAGGEKQVDSDEEEEEEREFDPRNTSAYPILYEEGRSYSLSLIFSTSHFSRFYVRFSAVHPFTF